MLPTMAGAIVAMAPLEPPFDLEQEVLVTAINVELGTDKLSGALSWLANCLQEQQRVIALLSERIDSLDPPRDAGDGRPEARGSISEGARGSMREELLVMQINALRHEVSAAPKNVDLESLRSRLFAEVTNLNSGFREEVREAQERTQRDLAAATDELREQLTRISSGLLERLDDVDARTEHAVAAAAAAAQAAKAAGLAVPEVAVARQSLLHEDAVPRSRDISIGSAPALAAGTVAPIAAADDAVAGAATANAAESRVPTASVPSTADGAHVLPRGLEQTAISSTGDAAASTSVAAGGSADSGAASAASARGSASASGPAGGVPVAATATTSPTTTQTAASAVAPQGSLLGAEASVAQLGAGLEDERRAREQLAEQMKALAARVQENHAHIQDRLADLAQAEQRRNEILDEVARRSGHVGHASHVGNFNASLAKEAVGDFLGLPGGSSSSGAAPKDQRSMRRGGSGLGSTHAGRPGARKPKSAARGLGEAVVEDDEDEAEVEEFEAEEVPGFSSATAAAGPRFPSATAAAAAPGGEEAVARAAIVPSTAHLLQIQQQSKEQQSRQSKEQQSRQQFKEQQSRQQSKEQQLRQSVGARLVVNAPDALMSATSSVGMGATSSSGRPRGEHAPRDSFLFRRRNRPTPQNADEVTPFQAEIRCMSLRAGTPIDPESLSRTASAAAAAARRPSSGENLLELQKLARRLSVEMTDAQVLDEACDEFDEVHDRLGEIEDVVKDLLFSIPSLVRAEFEQVMPRARSPLVQSCRSSPRHSQKGEPQAPPTSLPPASSQAEPAAADAAAGGNVAPVQTDEAPASGGATTSAVVRGPAPQPRGPAVSPDQSPPRPPRPQSVSQFVERSGERPGSGRPHNNMSPSPRVVVDNSAVEAELGEVVNRLALLEEKQREAEQAMKKQRQAAGRQEATMMTLDEMKAELERLRKLFDFVQGVLPKDASEAMSFFNTRCAEKAAAAADKARNAEFDASAADLAKPLGAEVEVQQHRARLEEHVQRHKETLQGELLNLRTAVKALQRDFGTDVSRLGDLTVRVKRIEVSGGPGVAQAAAGGAEEAGGLGAGATPESSREAPRPAWEADAEAGAGGADPSLVSQESLNQAVDALRDDVRNWLDALHSSMLGSLQDKAGIEDLRGIARQLLAKAATTSGGTEGEHLPLLALRGLMGRCASCDATISAEAAAAKRPPLVSSNQGLFPGTGASGARIAIRPPEDRGKHLNLAGPRTPPEGGKLPKITDHLTAKNFPKGKVLRNASQPELRSTARQDVFADLPPP